jgi:hypothetical protein
LEVTPLALSPNGKATNCQYFEVTILIGNSFLEVDMTSKKRLRKFDAGR